MEQIKFKASERAEVGSAAVRRLRRAGMLPGSVMRMNKGGTLLVKMDTHEFMILAGAPPASPGAIYTAA